MLPPAGSQADDRVLLFSLIHLNSEAGAGVTSVRSKPRQENKKGIQSPPDKGAFASYKPRPWILALVLALATIALYYPVSHHPFLNYDDDAYVSENVHIQSGLNWDTVRWAFTTFESANWHPLTWISHALDYQMFQLDPGGHHETNVVLHVANVLLLFWVLLRATGSVGPSLMVAALFALHPANVESVAWVSERKNLLSMLFFLLALGAYRWYAREPRVTRYAVVAALFALGMMAKPQVITFPFVLLLWDYWPLRRMVAGSQEASSEGLSAAMPVKSFSWLVLEKLPLFAICGASAAITLKAQRAAGAMSGLNWHPFSVRLENAIVSYVRYVGEAFWPSGLSLYYPHPGNSLVLWQVIAAAAVLLAVTVLALAVRGRRYLLVGWFWFLGTLVPMIGLVQVGDQGRADRYAYLSFIGLFIMLCWGVAEWARQHHISSAKLIGASGVALLALTVTTYRQIDYWGDNVTLWSHAVEVTKNNFVAEDHLGGALVADGRVEAAMPHFYRAVEINPDDPDSNLNIGGYEQQQKNLQQAVAQYKKVISATQGSLVLSAGVRAKAFNNMGYAYRELGDLPHARESFEAAVAMNPQYVKAWIGLGLVNQKSGNLGPAIQAYSQAMKLQPSDWGYLLLARALEQSGDNAAALAAIQQARGMTPNFERAQQGADRLLAQ
jgi:protein O-mannosyl-transferase